MDRVSPELGEVPETSLWTLYHRALEARRQSLLPGSDRQTVLAESALDGGWTEKVDAERPVLVTAQGLLMYFEPAEYQPPPWKWGLDGAEERRLRNLSPDIAALSRLPIPRGRGLANGFLLPLVGATPILRGALLSALRMST
jgi:hypothetical protein